MGDLCDDEQVPLLIARVFGLIAAGRAEHCRDVCDKLLGVVIRALHAEQAPDLRAEIRGGPVRPGDIPWLVGNPDLFSGLTGIVTRRISLELTVREAVAVGAW